MIDRCYIEITNTCNLNCHFCPKHTREKRQLSAEEFNLLTDKIRPKFEELGVLHFENLKHDGAIDWSTLEKPLTVNDGAKIIAA